MVSTMAKNTPLIQRTTSNHALDIATEVQTGNCSGQHAVQKTGVLAFFQEQTATFQNSIATFQLRSSSYPGPLAFRGCDL